MKIAAIVMTVVFIAICLGLTLIILLQEGKSAGLSGSINGMADSYWGKNKGRSMEGKLEKITRVLVIFFFALAIVLNISHFVF